MPQAYEFVSYWHLDAPIQATWDAIYHSETWPRWWGDVLRVDVLEPGDARGVGSLRRLAWKTALPYTFVFDTRTTHVEPPTVLASDAFGDLVGTGRWELATEDGVTRVRYDWNVRTSKAWMNLLAPVLRPAFEWNHTTVMRRGGRDLARHLGARLVSAS
jgi:uncharacterized protein YndB with AHSA1/START domain